MRWTLPWALGMADNRVDISLHLVPTDSLCLLLVMSLDGMRRDRKSCSWIKTVPMSVMVTQ